LSKKVEADGKFYCEIKSKADYLIFVDYAKAFFAKDWKANLGFVDSSLTWEEVAKEWFGIILVWSVPYKDWDSEAACRAECQSDPRCRAYVFSPYQAKKMREEVATGGVYVQGKACVHYNETWPIAALVYNRTKSPAAWITPGVRPYTRLFDFTALDSLKAHSDVDARKAYIDAHFNIQVPGLISGPHADSSLAAANCRTRCETHPACNSIAWPGCYLFNHSVDFWHSIEQKVTDNRHTVAYVKNYVSAKVHGVTGTSDVRARSEEGDESVVV
jgi:hypothetical protein